MSAVVIALSAGRGEGAGGLYRNGGRVAWRGQA